MLKYFENEARNLIAPSHDADFDDFWVKIACETKNEKFGQILSAIFKKYYMKSTLRFEIYSPVFPHYFSLCFWLDLYRDCVNDDDDVISAPSGLPDLIVTRCQTHHLTQWRRETSTEAKLRRNMTWPNLGSWSGVRQFFKPSLTSLNKMQAGVFAAVTDSACLCYLSQEYFHIRRRTWRLDIFSYPVYPCCPLSYHSALIYSCF